MLFVRGSIDNLVAFEEARDIYNRWIALVNLTKQHMPQYQIFLLLINKV